MKKIEHPNQGHLVSDYVVDGVSRVYSLGSNVCVVFESSTGIETANSILKNECLRLVIPMTELNKIYESFGDICNAFVEIKSQDNSLVTESEVEINKKETLSQPFVVGN